MIIRVYKAKSDGTFSTVPLGYLNVCMDALGNLDVNKTLGELKNNNYLYGNIEENFSIRNTPNTKTVIHPGRVYVVFDLKRKNHLMLVEVTKPPEPQPAFKLQDYYFTSAGGTGTATTGSVYGSTSTASVNNFYYTFVNNTNNR